MFRCTRLARFNETITSRRCNGIGCEELTRYRAKRLFLEVEHTLDCAKGGLLLVLAPTLVSGFVVATAAAQALPTERNLLANSSFEEIRAGQPEGWRWLAGAARAEMIVDGSVARSGTHSIKLTNPTPASPHVFGRLYTTVNLTPGRTYTLSCYTKSDDPGMAWIGTGRDWQFRFPLPPAKQWTRVVGTFEADDSTLEVMIVTESVTKGVWVDDVQLEPGRTARPYVYLKPLNAGQARLSVLQGEWVSVGHNLIANSSFEGVEGGMPRNWAFDPRNTNATLTIDETVAHTGKRSLKFTNGTTFGAHVYGMLSYKGVLSLEPNRDYTLSCYVRSADPGIAWIGGGPEWLIRAHFPRTGNRWQRVVHTFRTGSNTSEFPLLVITESPTEGFWVDDVKLERGAQATPHTDETGDAPAVLIDVPAQVVADAAANFGAWVFSPRPLSPATVTARLCDKMGKTFAKASWQGDLYAGIVYASFRVGVGSADPEDCEVVFVLAAGGTEVSAKCAFRLLIAQRERERLARMRKRTSQLRTLFAEAREKGFDAAYPLVSLTVAENFCDFVAEDLDHLEVVRARQQLDELDSVVERGERELRALLEGQAREPVVPRYITSPIDIDGTSFVATVRWPDGRTERRPVFFCGYGHFGSVKRDIEKLPDYGLNIIQVEFGPSSTLPAETEESTAPIEEFKRLLERAAASNVAVNLLLSPHYFPQWALEKWPELGGVQGGFIHFSVDAPQARNVLERHLRLTASNLKNARALHSYCLSNEPIYVDPSTDPNNASLWAEWLRNQYKDIAAVNEAHRANYASFREIPVPLKGHSTNTRLFYDWCRFNNERFSSWHKWMADVIHEADPAVPVHAKTMNTHFSAGYVAWGVDVEQFCDLSQIAGNDSWKYYDHGDSEWANGWQAQNMHFDLQRSCCGQPIFNSENHVIADRDLAPIPGVHIQNVLWQGAIHGQGASTMWVWERTFDPRSDFAGSIMHRPECADAHGRVALDLMRLAPEVTAFQKAPARIAVVYSIASLVYGGQESERQLQRVYRALNFLGEKLDFITEKQLAAGRAGSYEVIVAAGVTHLPEPSLRELAEFEGLILTTSNQCLSRNDLDQPTKLRPRSRMVVLSDTTERELRDEIGVRLADHGFVRPVIVQEAGTDREAWGIEWQSVVQEDRLLVNLVNYTKKPQQVSVAGFQGQALNLISNRPSGIAFELPPLQPVLLQFARPVVKD